MDHLLLHCKFVHTLGSEVFYLFGVSVGDVVNNSLSTFYMVELVGYSFFKCLEFGTALSYVVNLEGTQCPNI